MIAILVGDFGTGKTTLIKNNFLAKSKKEKLVYALIKKDFGEIPYESNFQEYVKKAVIKKDTLFIVDEAKTCIRHKEPDIKKEHDRSLLIWLLNARKCNNFIVIVFHTLRDIPIWLISYSDFFLRFRTNDLLQHQHMRFSSFPSVTKSIDETPTMENFEYDEIKLR